MDDLDSLLQDLQRPAHTEADSQTVNLAELDDLMNDLQDDSRKNPALSTPANELDDLLNDLSLGSAPAPAASSKPVAASQPVSSPAPQRDELDDLLNDLDAPAPKSSPPPAQNRSQPAQPPASVAVDDLDDLLDGLDEPAPRRKVSTTNTGGGNDVDSLFGDINSAARSSGAANQTQNQNRVANNSNSTSGPSRGNCAGCNQAVHGEVLQASGKLWHMNCFCCGNCADLLGSASFFEFEGSPHCEKCYKGLFCPRCAKCDKSITDRVVTALGKKWHPDCFSCSTCNQAFPGGSFFGNFDFDFDSDSWGKRLLFFFTHPFLSSFFFVFRTRWISILFGTLLQQLAASVRLVQQARHGRVHQRHEQVLASRLLCLSGLKFLFSAKKKCLEN